MRPLYRPHAVNQLHSTPFPLGHAFLSGDWLQRSGRYFMDLIQVSDRPASHNPLIRPVRMKFCFSAHILAVTLQLTTAYAAPFFWPNITNVFGFGDSYTDTYARVINGRLSPPQDSKVRFELVTLLYSHWDTYSYMQTTSGGHMWIEYLTETYNVSDVNLYNFAYVVLLYHLLSLPLAFITVLLQFLNCICSYSSHHYALY
jgi:hypothetical protein